MKIGLMLPLGEDDGLGRAHSWSEIRELAVALSPSVLVARGPSAATTAVVAARARGEEETHDEKRERHPSFDWNRSQVELGHDGTSRYVVQA